MWGAVCAGILTVNLCMDPCTTMILLAITAIAIVLMDTHTTTYNVERREKDVSARVATSETDEVGKGENVVREMTPNARRVDSHAEKVERVHPLTNGCTVPNRSSESHRRLLSALKNEMSETQHQFSDPRMSKKGKENE